MLEVPGYSCMQVCRPCVQVKSAIKQPWMKQYWLDKAQCLKNKILCRLHGATCASGPEGSHKGALRGGNVSWVVGLEQQRSKAFLASKQQWVSCHTNPWVTPRACFWTYSLAQVSTNTRASLWNIKPRHEYLAHQVVKVHGRNRNDTSECWWTRSAKHELCLNGRMHAAHTHVNSFLYTRTHTYPKASPHFANQMRRYTQSPLTPTRTMNNFMALPSSVLTSVANTRPHQKCRPCMRSSHVHMQHA